MSQNVCYNIENNYFRLCGIQKKFHSMIFFLRFAYLYGETAIT